MVKLFAIFVVVAALYGIECVPMPDGLESFFKNSPIFNTEDFEKAIKASMPDLNSLQPLKLGDGVNGVVASIYSQDGHGRMSVIENGKKIEKTFRK